MYLRTIENICAVDLVFIMSNSDKRVLALEDLMNWSLYTADSATHPKVVVVGLSVALLISLIGIAATEFNRGADVMTAQSPTVIKAGSPVVFTQRDGPVVR